MQIVGIHGDVADVNKYGQVQVEPQDASVYRNSLGQAFSAYYTQTPSGPANTFAALVNNSVYSVVVDEISVAAAAAETIRVQVGSALGVSGGTDSTTTKVVCKKVGGQSVTFNANFWYTGNAVTVTDPGFTADAIGCSNGAGYHKYAPQSKIILPPGKMLWLKASNGSVALEGAIHFYVVVS